jgi:aryl-alcohol dehydrogenase-like predicted oxidoreductase
VRAPDHRIVLGLHRSRHECGLLTAALDLGITRIDTSFNYRDFTSHAALSRLGSGLLDRCSLSTKIGFFPRHDGTAEHSLDAARLRQALEQTNRDLRRAPDLVFLHNPERSLFPAPRGVQAAFRAAYHLPPVATVAVGSDDAEHLRELVDALHLNANEATVRQYRKLLRDHSRRQRARSSPTIRSAAIRAGASLGSASSAQRPTTFVQ